MDHMKDGQQPTDSLWSSRFYHNTLVFAKWRRKHASKNSSSSQDETNYTHFVPGQQLLVLTQAGGGHCLLEMLVSVCSSRFLARRALWQVIPSVTPSGFWHSISQSINPSSVTLLFWWANPIKLWASFLAVCFFFLHQCHGQIRCHSLGLSTTCLYTSCSFSRQD